MASKVKKGFLYYLLWLVFICFGVVCIFATMLLLNPNKDVFGIGIRYYANSNTTNYDEIEVDGVVKPLKDITITDVSFSSDYANLNVVKNDYHERITFAFDRKIKGFTKSKVQECSLKLNLEGTSLTVEVIAPDFWIPLSKALTVTMYCPQNLSFENYNFDIKTNSGKVEFGIGNCVDFQINTLNIETKTGNININKKLTVNSGIINIKTVESETFVYSNVQTRLNVETTKGKLFVDEINGDLNIDANTLSVKCNKIYGNVKYSSGSGYIRINKLGNGTTGNFTADVDKMHIANVVIGEMIGNITIPNGESSNITVNKLGGEALINTTLGNVKIGQASQDLTITTTLGRVEVIQLSPDAKTDITTTNGSIWANFTEIGTARLTTTKGTIAVSVATDKTFVFDYATGGKVSISWIAEKLDKTGTIYVAGATSSTINKIEANSTSGNIILKDGYVIPEED